MNNQIKLVILRCLSLCLVMVLLIGLLACGKEQQEPLQASMEGTMTTVSIETAYGTLAFPEELFENLRHVEVTEGHIAMEVFYMIVGEGEKELYRIHYADGQMGTPMGYLTTENSEIIVSYSICEYLDEDFTDEEERKLYYSMMDAFSTIINSIYADSRFSETRAIETVDDLEVKLRYWNVTLPENVQYTETEENGNYRVDFYGEVSGERINLYMIGLGDLEGETVLGWYTVDGVQKPVVVQTYSLDAYENWQEEGRTIMYKMMESLNSVIQTIVSDTGFTETQNIE